MNEIWRDVIGYEGLYQVSNLGRVKALPKRGHKSLIMKQTIKKDGYIRIQLSKDAKSSCLYVHRLVADAFLPKTPEKSEVNHIDGNKSNNALFNLEWVTRSDNTKHALKTGLRTNPTKGKFGSTHPTAKKIYQYDLNGNLIKIWGSASEAERLGNFNAKSIYMCVEKRRLSYKKYIWKHE